MPITRKSLMQRKVKRTWRALTKSLIAHLSTLVLVILCLIISCKAILVFNPEILTSVYGWLFIALFVVLFIALVFGVIMSGVEKIDWYMTSLYNYIGLGVDIEFEMCIIDKVASEYGYAVFSPEKRDACLHGEKIGHEETLEEVMKHIPRID